jgi:hypothetical protein
VPLPRGAHLQRLGFRVGVCLNHAKRNNLSATKMLAMIKEDPVTVYRLSARKPATGFP